MKTNISHSSGISNLCVYFCENNYISTKNLSNKHFLKEHEKTTLKTIKSIFFYIFVESVGWYNHVRGMATQGLVIQIETPTVWAWPTWIQREAGPVLSAHLGHAVFGLHVGQQIVVLLVKSKEITITRHSHEIACPFHNAL